MKIPTFTLSMEVFLIVAIPRKRSYQRLRMVVRELPRDFLPSDLLPKTCGATFWPFKLKFLHSLANPYEISRQSIALHSNMQRDYREWGFSYQKPSQEFVDKIGYRWQVVASSRGSNLSQMHDETEDELSPVPARTAQFLFGKGNLLESLSIDAFDTRVQLDRILTILPEISRLGFNLSWYEHSDTLEVTVLGSDGPHQTCTLDMRYLEPIPSNLPEDWALHRVRRLLAKPESSLEEFGVMILDLHQCIKQTFFVFHNLVGTDHDGTLGSEVSLTAKKTLTELAAWMGELSTYVSDPLTEVINQKQHSDLMTAFLFLEHPSSYSHGLRCEVSSNGGFRQLLGELLDDLIVVLQNDEDDPSDRLRQTRDRLFDSKLCEFVLEIHILFATMRPQKSAAEALLQKLAQAVEPTTSVSSQSIPECFTVEIIQSLHSHVVELIKGHLATNLAGAARQMSTVNPDNRMEFLGSLDSMQVLWSIRSSSGSLLIHTKSQVDGCDQSIVEILPTGSQAWHSIPRQFLSDYDRIEFGNITKLDRDSVWILRQHAILESYHLPVLRIEWQGISLSGTVTKVICALGRLQDVENTSRYSLVAYDDCLLFQQTRSPIDYQPLRKPVLRAIRVQNFGQTLSDSQPLVDVTECVLLGEMDRLMPIQHRVNLGICRTSNRGRLVSFSCLCQRSDPDFAMYGQSIGLSLVCYNLEAMQYQILKFGSWRIKTSMNFECIDIRSLSVMSTFRIAHAEYFLYSQGGCNMLINFDSRGVSLVTVGRSQVHKLPKELSHPVKYFGIDCNLPNSLFCLNKNRVTDSRSYPTLFRLKYRPS